MPGEEYGGGTDLGGTWVPEESSIDPYALQQQPTYPDPSSTSGDGAWDPYAGGSPSDPYFGSAPPEEALPEEPPAVPEGDDPSASGSF